MKKVIAVLLSVICLFTVFAAVVSAEELGDATLIYGITYENEAAGVKMMYSPKLSAKFPGEGYVTVTSDTPIAIDHDFICWKDEEGKLYYEGDVVYVNGNITLNAVWEPKTDNYPYVVRTIRCALLTLERIFLKAFGVIKDINDFEPSTPTTVANP